MIEPTPDYKNLDLSGEALQAAARMEARAREVASEEMFQKLIAPLLTSEVKTVLEFGCGTAALSRRIARAATHAVVYASDKSEGMLKVSQHLVAVENLTNIRLERWDVIEETAFPFPNQQFELIISSVVIPYLDDSQTITLIEKLASRLAPRGILAFVEQDLMTDSISFPNFDLFRHIVSKDLRNLKRTLALGLRAPLRQAGLQVLPRRSFLWTDEAYGVYTRDLLERFAHASRDRGQITLEEEQEWKKTLDEIAKAGDFYYGLVYHLVAGRHA